MTDDQKLLPAPELIRAVFGKNVVTPRWLLAMARAGRVPSVKIGKHRLFSPDQVRDCLLSASKPRQ